MMRPASALMLACAAFLASPLVLASPAAATDDRGLDQAIHGPFRTPSFAARDAIRHPADVLTFFGLRQDATVVEIWPGGGYWTEILAPYLYGHGTYYAAVPGDSGEAKEAARFRARVADNRPAFSHVMVTEAGGGHFDIAPPGSADVVLTFRNVHNWMDLGEADAMFAAFYKALKPGGVLGVEEHRGRIDTPQDPKAESGYVRQDYTIALAEKAGFKLAGSSEVNANPRDTKIWPQGVWTLPPSFALGAQDHAKYAAIGEADNFVLKFQKPPR